MRRTGIMLLLLAAGMVASGCGAMSLDAMAPRAGYESDSKAMANEAASTDESPPASRGRGEPQAASDPPAGVEPRKVIYTAKLDIIVADVQSALVEARKVAADMGGYMQHMSGRSITIRVPAEKFNAAVASISKLGPVSDRDITAQDVTEQYTDLEIRLSNGRAALKRLQALLDKAANVKDVLAIEKELIRVRTEIERLQGRMNLLKSRIAYATITVNFNRSAAAPSHIRVKLPFWWLSQLGLDTLMSF